MHAENSNYTVEMDIPRQSTTSYKLFQVVQVVNVDRDWPKGIVQPRLTTFLFNRGLIPQVKMQGIQSLRRIQIRQVLDKFNLLGKGIDYTLA